MGALNLGIRREERIEVLMHTPQVGGIPAAVSALDAAAEILKRRRIRDLRPGAYAQLATLSGRVTAKLAL